ncbi:MAG: hypothetical protein A2544_00680 [Candidatus Zambryskibacteria bacterium RIFOXYD2_FULL_43_10]|uniref:Uncharacterized protein n=1 Tax=Candidatus Zambryskibacteria bacterium RIFOXYD2_FULL_43_10 TaxID=1802782 RepID=A0A1G2V7H3_9BACT|nr:MAG: hypothetical protein A2544_00680 [Candidatus Zambryskibacteria bacterium RIFOXYD2_FULL_43_10]
MGKFNFKDSIDFEAVREKAEVFYSNIGSVHCPYFQSKVAFNAKGIRHLKFKSDEVARPREDQYSRLKLVHLAPEVLKLSKTVQGIWNTQCFETQKTNSRWKRSLKNVTFYEFMAVLNNVRVKVIVKEVLGGEKHFWSVIPFWGIDKDKSKRVLHSGDPEND